MKLADGQTINIDMNGTRLWRMNACTTYKRINSWFVSAEETGGANRKFYLVRSTDEDGEWTEIEYEKFLHLRLVDGQIFAVDTRPYTPGIVPMEPGVTYSRDSPWSINAESVTTGHKFQLVKCLVKEGDSEWIRFQKES